MSNGVKICTDQKPISRTILKNIPFNYIEEVPSSELLGKISNFTKQDPEVYLMRAKSKHYFLLTLGWFDTHEPNNRLAIETKAPGWRFEKFKNIEEKHNFLKIQEDIKAQAKEIKLY